MPGESAEGYKAEALRRPQSSGYIERVVVDVLQSCPNPDLDFRASERGT